MSGWFITQKDVSMHKVSYASVTRACALSLLAVGFYLFSSSSGFAGATVGSILCSIWAQIDGDIGRGVATIAVATLGISALVGKVSWGMAIMVAVGCTVLFSADILLGQVGLSHC
jgi:type IV secretory pathway VirB2 component (pilin)